MIDLRSDTVTRPSRAMLDAMHRAETGDDVYGEDPSVNQLEKLAAEITGMDAAIFAPSGTQTNLLALMGHCQRGEEYIVGQQAHTFSYEGGGAAVLGSIQPQPVENQPDGSLDLEGIERYIKPDDIHFAPTRLLCLENTIGGQALPMKYLAEVGRLAQKHKLALHLDGARVFNAAIKHGVAVKAICSEFDSVSVCLSKGLGAPVGSVLCGSKELIRNARRQRKMLGGGMRQAGSLAAAGIYALTHNVERLVHDHTNAAKLDAGLSEIDELITVYSESQTNMVFVEPRTGGWQKIIDHMKNEGILISGRYNLRLVSHLDVNEDDIARTISAFKNYFSRSRAA